MPIRILVVRENDRWQVKCAHCGRAWAWDLESEALRSARAHVASLPEGKVLQIVVQTDAGELEANWTLGRDPFPPRD
jgi:hypothetical protein